MAPNEEQMMVLKARAGDNAAFGKLYTANVARIYSVVASRTRNREDIDDLVQVAFIRAYEGLNRFRGESTFSTWLTRIAMNVCVSHYESQAVRRKWASWFHSPEGTRQIGPRWTEDPETTMHTRECQHVVRRGIQTLPPQYREAMRLRYVEDYSYAEIEKTMDSPMGTVKTWLYRGREMLQENIEEQGIAM
ncbi:MAG: RNA polymerase sigma factor [Candidatus Latescibacteria bacterium]|jgi:RNA polymerase sigma-70 factor (ECF subfamily)|nr:RNA polymerase sigma factor [Candidatus Latescibacterota bacterium]